MEERIQSLRKLLVMAGERTDREIKGVSRAVGCIATRYTRPSDFHSSHYTCDGDGSCLRSNLSRR